MLNPEDDIIFDGFDPHVAEIEDDILDPPDYDKIMKESLRYNIKHIDRANPAGINKDGQMISIVGAKKNRKTTLAMNLVRNWCYQEHRLDGKKILWDTLESGQTPKSVKQQLICMEATYLMAVEIWGSIYNIPKLKQGMDEYTNMSAVRDARDPANPDSNRPLFVLSRQFSLSATRSPLQHKCLVAAKHRVDKWPLLFCGAPSTQGGTRMLQYPEGGVLENFYPYRRWKWMVETMDVGFIVADHVNAYRGVNDYDRQQKGIVHASSAVSDLGVIFVAICQPSRSSTQNGSGLKSRGGDRWEEESNTVKHVEYRQNDDKIKIICADAREAPFPDIYTPIDKHSGLMFPDSYPVK